MISRWLVSGLSIASAVISFQLFAYTAVKVDESQQAEQVGCTFFYFYQAFSFFAETYL